MYAKQGIFIMLTASGDIPPSEPNIIPWKTFAHICCLSKLLTQFFHLYFYGVRKRAQSKPISVCEDKFKNSLSGGSVVH